MTKEELEKRKLELEIKKLKVSWINNIEFWKVLIPTLAILATLYFTFGRGILDAEKSKLEIQKEQLRLDISRFEIKRDELTASINNKDSIKNALEKEIIDYRIQKRELMNKATVLKNQLSKAGIEIENISLARSEDKDFYQKVLLEEYRNEKSHLEKLNDLESKLNTKDVLIASLEAELKFLKPKIKLTEREEFDLSDEKLVAEEKVYKKQFLSFDIKSDSLHKKYEAEKKRINSMTVRELEREVEIFFLKRKIGIN